MERQTKVAQEELALPFWLLKYCDRDLPKCGTFEEALLEAASDMDTLRNNCTKLYQRNINILLSYLLNALGNKKEILAAESDIMGIMVMLCSRSDCVAHFHHKNGINYILEEVQDLLSVYNDRNNPGGLLALCAGQSFANLIYHLDVNLVDSLHLFLRPCIDLVSEWCRLRLRRGIIDGQVMPYLFSAVANLLATHPEQAITILSERGRHLLNYAKRSYRAAKHIGRDALNKYLSSHL